MRLVNLLYLILERPDGPSLKNMQSFISRSFAFIIISVFFIFSFPYVSSQLRLNTAIGWEGRAVWTYLLPAWFLLIAMMYKRLEQQHARIGRTFFIVHLLLTAIPPLTFNYPFALIFLKESLGEEMVRNYFLLYSILCMYNIAQIVFAILLGSKFYRRPSRQ
jgi:hypothetical protein